MNDHLTALFERYPRLSVCGDDIMRALSVLTDCYRADEKVLICGNGGSSADAEHWAGELLKELYLYAAIDIDSPTVLEDIQMVYHMGYKG